MPPLDMPLNLPALARRSDEWSLVAQYLSLADLGRVQSVSSVFLDAVTPRMMERAALALIRQEEDPSVAAGDLRTLRCHPAAQPWADSGFHAAACLASLHHAGRLPVAGRAGERVQHPVESRVRMLDLATRALTRDGRVIVWGQDVQSLLVAKYVVRAGQIMPLTLPDGFRTAAAIPRINSSKHFLRPPPDCWLLMNADRELHYYHTDSRQLVRLPMARSTTPHTVDLSRSGRFVAIATSNTAGPGETRLQCYDRERDQVSLDARISDANLFQISVADDGRLFVGSYTRGYAFSRDGDVTLYSFAGGNHALFRLSPDERFLMRSCSCIGEGNCNDIVLQDLGNGRETRLPRDIPPRTGQSGAMRPESIAFSLLNRLVAIAYEDGALQIFDLRQGAAGSAPVMARGNLPVTGVSLQPHTSFDGFDRVCTVFRQRIGREVTLAMHTMDL
ncbi:hypothetical protein DFO50_1117 [Microvirgula sp. AG722]|nr:hypothetical protein DFO50_1117 [Microvirgula sp. AG722]